VGVLSAVVVAAVVVGGGAFTPLGQLTAAALLAAILAWWIGCWRGSLDTAEWLALGVVLWGVVPVLVRPGHPLAAKEMLAAWLVAWLLWVAARRSGGVSGRWLLPVIAGASGVVAVAAILECAAAQQLRMGGLYLNPNVAAALIVPVLPLVWRHGATTPPRWALGLSVVLVAGTVATGSRAGLLALVIAIFFAMAPGRGRTIAVVVAAAAAAGLLSWRFLWRPDALAWHRLEIWRALMELTAAHPIVGVGPGWLEEATGTVRIAHAEPVARFRHIIGSAESTALGLIVRTGIVGGCLGLASLASWLRGAWREGAFADRGLRSMIAVVAVFGAFHDMLDQNVVLWWWAVLLGVALPVSDAEGNPQTEAADSRAARWVTAVAAAGLVLWGLAQPAFARLLWFARPSSPELAQRVLRAEPWLAEAARWQTLDLLERPEWSWRDAAEALYWSGLATRLRPTSHRLWSEYGVVNFRLVEDLGGWGDAVDRAREAFGRATEIEPHLAWHWLRWAQLERVLGELDRALELAGRAVEEEPNFVRGWLFVARLELDRGRGGAASAALDRALTAHDRARWRTLSDYERDLISLPTWQRDQLRSEISAFPIADLE
jgi:hypothetical protein